MKVIFIVGPTASGKTKVAIELAKKFGGEIISCDSIQVYEGLNVGSSKPSEQEQEGIRHHLLSTVKKGQKYTAGEFRRDALHILQKSAQPVMWVVGGTGFYFKALEVGMTENPKMEALQKKQYEEEFAIKGAAAFYQELLSKDPARAKEISPNDSYRIFRAVEILRLGFLPSQIQQEFQPTPFPYPLLKLGIDVNRDVLRQRVEHRVKAMLDAGFIEEVKTLRQEGLMNWEPMQSVGYKEIGDYLEQKISREELLPLITTKTMQLAKRQMTWFKKDLATHWFPNENMVEMISKVESFL